MNFDEDIDITRTFASQFSRQADLIDQTAFAQSLEDILSLNSPIKADYYFEKFQLENNYVLKQNPFYVYILEQRFVIVYVVCEEIQNLEYQRYFQCCQDIKPKKVTLIYFGHINDRYF